MSVLLVLCSCPDPTSAGAIAEGLIEHHLAACVSAVPGVRSVYRWQGAVHRDEETLLLIKTTIEQFDALKVYIVMSHPSAVPEILGFAADRGLDRYLSWVHEETTHPPEHAPEPIE